MIAFMRPQDTYFNTQKNGNIISFQYWQNCYRDAGLPEPDCWKQGLLKPDNHTVSVSDLAYIGAHHGMVTLEVGEIKKFHPDGQNVVLVDGRQLEVDIVIKCTGFHLNTDVPKFTGHDKMYPTNHLDFNLGYCAEPLLDGAQFGSAKGGAATGDDMSADIAFLQGIGEERMKAELPADVMDILVPRANPFGSGYTGMMMTNFRLHAWMSKNSGIQERAMRAWKAPGVDAKLDTVKAWASHMGTKLIMQNVRLVARALSADNSKVTEATLQRHADFDGITA